MIRGGMDFIFLSELIFYFFIIFIIILVYITILTLRQVDML